MTYQADGSTSSEQNPLTSVLCQTLSMSQPESIISVPGRAKTCLMPYANNKGADQPAHPRSLISAFVVRSLDSIISLVSRFDISRF